MRLLWRYIKQYLKMMADLFTPPQEKYRKMGLFAKTDSEALASDWQKVGDDIRVAISEYEKSTQQEVG